MAQDYSNLKEKTFLDFTEDKALINKITGYTDPIQFVENISDYGRYVTFLEFAEETKNKLLEEEVEKQLGSIANE